MPEPNDYVFNELKFRTLPLDKQKNYVKYAKGQITHFKKLVENNKEDYICPSNKTQLSWWKDILTIIELEYEINKANTCKK